MIYCSGSSLCGTMFLKLAPKFYSGFPVIGRIFSQSQNGISPGFASHIQNPYKASDKKKSKRKQGSCVSESDIFEENTLKRKKLIQI